jgi:hypothetical protein
MPLPPPTLPDNLFPGYADAVDALSVASQYYQLHKHRKTDPLFYEARDRLRDARQRLQRVTAILQPDPTDE